MVERNYGTSSKKAWTGWETIIRLMGLPVCGGMLIFTTPLQSEFVHGQLDIEVEQEKSVVDVALASRIIASLDDEVGLNPQESELILELAQANWDTQREVIRLGLASSKAAERLYLHAAFVIRAVLSLDPTSNRSTELLESYLAPRIRDNESSPEIVATAFELLRFLRIPRETAFSLLFEWLQEEQHLPSDILSVFEHYAESFADEHASKMAELLVKKIIGGPDRWGGTGLDYLIDSLDEAQVDELVTKLTEWLRSEPKARSRQAMRNALLVLAAKVQPDVALRTSQLLLDILHETKDSPAIVGYAEILLSLSAKLNGGELSLVAKTLFERFIRSIDSYEINRLGSILADLSLRTESKDEEQFVDALERRLKTVINPTTRGLLAEQLALLAKNLDSSQTRSVAKLIMDEMTKQEGYQREELNKAFCDFAQGYRADDADWLATEVLHRFLNRDGVLSYEMYDGFVLLSAHLNEGQVRSVSHALVHGILKQSHSVRLVSQCAMLARFDNKLESGEMLPVIERLIADINKETELYARGNLVSVVEPLAVRLSAQQTSILATKLVERMTSETDPEWLADLGMTLKALSAQIDPTILRPAIAAVAERIQVEQLDSALEDLIRTFNELQRYWQPQERRLFAHSLVSRLKSERDHGEFLALAQLIVSMKEDMSSEDLKLSGDVLAGRFEHERDGETIVLLAELLADFPFDSNSEQRVEIAERLLASLSMAFFDREFKYKELESLPGLRSIIAHAKLQSLVEALKSPLLEEPLIIKTILNVLEGKAGQDFHGNTWEFVEWALNHTDANGVGFDLEGIGPWAKQDSLELPSFPILERVQFEALGLVKVNGTAFSFDVKRDFAYLTVGGGGLIVVDLEDREQPHEISHVNAGPYALSVCVSGNYAYVAAGPMGWPESHLHVVDMADVKAPKLVGSLDLPDYPSSVAVQGHYVFIADHSKGLRVIDVSSPTKPAEVASLETPGFIVDVALTDGVAFLADKEVGLRIVDISDPLAPRQIGLVPTSAPCLSVSIEGKLAVIATGEDGIVLVDISDPSKPNPIATIPVGFAIDVSLHNKLVAVAAARLGVQVIDVSDYQKPKRISLDMTFNGASVQFQGDRLYVTDVDMNASPFGVFGQSIFRVYEVSR